VTLFEDVDRYLEDVVVGSEPVLEEVLRESERAGLPPHQVSPLQGRLLTVLAGLVRPSSILEIGTLGGYSAICLARALVPGGRLVTLESEERCARVARANVERAGLGGVVDVRVGPALDTLPGLGAADGVPFDVVFIDGNKDDNDRYLDWAIRLGRPGTLIVADNVVRKGAVIDPESTDPAVLGVRRFLEAGAADPRVDLAALQVVGAKKHDGLAIATIVSDEAAR
jgi:predicted O-methyltransferase YrrM